MEVDKLYKKLSIIFNNYGVKGVDDQLIETFEQRYKELLSEVE